jgi:uncharacterized membrane protein YagU involved in acid resistance
MAAIYMTIFVVAAGFAFVIAVTIIVIVGVHKEERYLTLWNRHAPGATAQLARMVLGRYVRRECDAPQDDATDDHLLPSQRSAGTRY